MVCQLLQGWARVLGSAPVRVKERGLGFDLQALQVWQLLVGCERGVVAELSLGKERGLGSLLLLGEESCPSQEMERARLPQAGLKGK